MAYKKSKQSNTLTNTNKVMKKLVVLFLAMWSVCVTGQTLEIFSDGFPPQYGFRNKATKEVVIPLKYTHAEDFVGGVAAVSETPLGSPNMRVQTKWRIIDTKGNYLSPDTLLFDKVEVRGNGLAIVYMLVDKKAGGRVSYNDNYKVGVFKKDGTYLFPCEYDNIKELKEGYIRIYSQEKGAGIIDKNGSIVIAPQTGFIIKEYVGCGLFQYINPGGKRTAMNDPLSGGLVDTDLKIWIDQDSADFVPSTIINITNCAKKNALLGFTQPHRAGSAGIYRVGFGLVVPIDTYDLEGDEKRGSEAPHKYQIATNLITIKDESFDNRYAKDKTVAKYDWDGKVLYSK